jgi:hypothetical protein
MWREDLNMNKSAATKQILCNRITLIIGELKEMLCDPSSEIRKKFYDGYTDGDIEQYLDDLNSLLNETSNEQ